MLIKKEVLYRLVLLSFVVASLWVCWNFTHYHQDSNSGINVCLFKRITGIPCPSCGSTRSLLYISRLDFKNALYANPIGFILAVAILLFPFWVLYDLVNHKNSFYNFYRDTEFFIRKRWVTISLIFLITANWFWNIYKYY